MAQKSILEQALLQVQTLEEAVKQNAKGILASTMKQELNELLKESEEEEDELPEEEENDMSEQPEIGDDEEGDEENVDDLDNEDMDDMEDEFDFEGDDSEDEAGFDDDMNFEGGMDDDTLDMTGASDDEVLKVFKAMRPEDGIVVKKDGDDVELEMDGDEYIIKLDETDDEDEMAEGWGEGEDELMEGDDDMMEGDDETVYEIELDEEDDNEEKIDKEKFDKFMGDYTKFKYGGSKKGEGADKDKPKKGEHTEARRTKSNIHGDKGPGQGRAGLKSKKVYKAGSGSLNEEVETLKKQNAEYKKALVLFKEKLNEVAVFNANLAYATRLFTEQSTTKQEKLNILKRFDAVSTMNESKNLFNTIKNELENKKPVTESVVNKISSTPSSSSSKELLSEAKAYENPQFKRMRDLMSKVK